jgi:hypothetical protein
MLVAFPTPAGIRKYEKNKVHPDIALAERSVIVIFMSDDAAGLARRYVAQVQFLS